MRDGRFSNSHNFIGVQEVLGRISGRIHECLPHNDVALPDRTSPPRTKQARVAGLEPAFLRIARIGTTELGFERATNTTAERGGAMPNVGRAAGLFVLRSSFVSTRRDSNVS